ncbi:hypothetical protein AG1IA_09362 [Rhizoctonia solani AG-1 IA]|uniref:Uncharacterized protein n=1 Tax=Thanatephorus cucumeris (strain AG1-IA) TaxID=983506 RepID=L8WIN8_THACA|nr:hypothetical protein AG1IA_09362 [Rhizoctonia solani AG-1 IA]
MIKCSRRRGIYRVGCRSPLVRRPWNLSNVSCGDGKSCFTGLHPLFDKGCAAGTALGQHVSRLRLNLRSCFAGVLLNSN